MKKFFGFFFGIASLMLLVTFSLSRGVYAENTTWQDDWTFTKNTTNKTITLTKYQGSEEDYRIPAKAIIDEEEYSVILGNASNSSNKPLAGSIKNLSVEEGVKINNLNYLFYQTTNIETVDLTGANTSSSTTLQGMFYGATNVKKVVLSGLDLSKVTNVRYMFYQASNIEEIDFSDTDMSSVTTFAYSSPNNSYASTPYMSMTKLKKINMKNFNTSSLTTAERMFIIQVGSYDNQNHIEDLDVTNWNTSNVTTFYETFAYCGINEETVIRGLDTLDTSNVTNFSGTFMATEHIKDLTGVEEWDTSSATNFHSMFSGAKSITKLDLSGWDTSNVTDIGSMFVSCESLSDLNVSTWDTSKVKAMDTVFKGCASLEVLNLKNWTSESVADKAGSHMMEMLGAKNPSGEYPLTPLREITLNDNFKFSLFQSPSLRSGYWHLKEDSDEETTPKFTPGRLYTAYNNGVTPPSGYSHDHTYVLTELDPADAEYYAQGWGDNNTWEVHYPTDKFKAYCINLHRGSPNGYYDRTKVSGNSIIDLGFLDSDDYGWGPLGSNMEEALITLIYYGYSNDADGIQEKYGLTNDEFLLVTQNAIWNFTDRYSNKKEYDPETKTGKAYNELMSKRFSDIPNNENLKLYLYESLDGKQNLLSISGLSDTAHAGARILKLANASDGSLEPLAGAEFTIYNKDSQEVAVIRSDENGYATKYNTDSIYGLPEGVYRIKETKAPRGYNPTPANRYYTFIVRPTDDNEIISIGKLNGEGDDMAMIFENTNDTTVEGGGLIVKIVDEQDEPILTGAEFEILDEDGSVIDTITTDGNGKYMTGNKDLDLNKKYTVRLKTPPVGYLSTIEIQSETLTENEQYKTLIFKFVKKTCSINVEATKKYNGDLSKDKFDFELYSYNDGKTLKSTNDANGKVRFNLAFNASNIGNMLYELKEIQGTSKKISYDTNSFEIMISVSDQGNDSLTCEVIQENLPEFVNYVDADPPENRTDINPPNTGRQSGKNSIATLYQIGIFSIAIIQLLAIACFLAKKLNHSF